MQEMATMIDFRFGHGTWAGIIAERARRIQEEKEARLAAKRKAQQEYNELMRTAQAIIICIVIGIAVMAIGYAAWQMYS